MRPRLAESDLLWTEIIRQEERRARDAQAGKPGTGIAQKKGPFEYRMAPCEVQFAAIMVFRADPFPFVEACSPVGGRCCAAAEEQTFHKFALAWWRWSAARSGDRLYWCEDCRPGLTNCFACWNAKYWLAAWYSFGSH